MNRLFRKNQILTIPNLLSVVRLAMIPVIVWLYCGVKNYKVSVKDLQGSIVFLRKIMRGGTNRSFGIEVAELAGVEKSVTDSAKKILKRLEKSDLTRQVDFDETPNNIREDNKISECERIIKDIDINNLTPMQAFNIILDLNEKLKG